MRELSILVIGRTRRGFLRQVGADLVSERRMFLGIVFKVVVTPWGGSHLLYLSPDPQGQGALRPAGAVRLGGMAAGRAGSI
jgi:hypothetical protein